MSIIGRDISFFLTRGIGHYKIIKTAVLERRSIMDAIRQKRKEKKLTLRQLAKMVGCSESAISQYENGKRCPDYEMLLKIAEALDSSVSFLLTGVEDTAPVHFSRDEEELLHHYLSLTPERKTMVLEFARFLNRPE